jgi:5'-methylthioadenosine phosphorylase
MTGVPEVVFAREAGLCYASICVVTNPAAGVEPEHRLSAEEVTTLIDAKRRDLIRLLEETASRLPPEHSCRCLSP